ncbi:MAG TPA: formyltransferase family protein [Anaeromyxobacteraceae bacterium]
MTRASDLSGVPGGRSATTGSSLRLAVAVSTGGAVLGRLLAVPTFRRSVVLMASDRACGGLERARGVGVATALLPAADGRTFSDALLPVLREHRVEWLISFYTRLFAGPLLGAYRDRILNLHPSLLPAFPGLRSVEQTVAAGARFAGSTIHLVNEELDRGGIVLQAAFPLDPQAPFPETRHRIFVQQCRSLLQVVQWLAAERLETADGRARVVGARYLPGEYAPNLESGEALELDIAPPPPGTFTAPEPAREAAPAGGSAASCHASTTQRRTAHAQDPATRH